MTNLLRWCIIKAWKGGFMLTNKEEVIQELSKDYVDFSTIDRRLLKDIDVIRAYIAKHSSNNIVQKGFIIDIDIPGFIDKPGFIVEIIQGLDVGYDEKALNSLLKYSAEKIVRREADNNPNCTTQQLQELATKVLTRYKEAKISREQQLKEKREMLESVNKVIDGFNLDVKNNKLNQSRGGTKYKRHEVGFMADI